MVWKLYKVSFDDAFLYIQSLVIGVERKAHCSSIHTAEHWVWARFTSLYSCECHVLIQRVRRLAYFVARTMCERFSGPNSLFCVTCYTNALIKNCPAGVECIVRTKSSLVLFSEIVLLRDYSRTKNLLLHKIRTSLSNLLLLWLRTKYTSIRSYLCQPW